MSRCPRPISGGALILVLLRRCCQVGDSRAGLMRGPSLRLQSWEGLENQHTFTASGQLPSRACLEWLSITWLMSSKISPTGCPVSESHCHAARVWQLVYRFSGGGECETLGCPCSESSSGWEWHPVWIFSLLIAPVLSLWPCPCATPMHTVSSKRALDIRKSKGAGKAHRVSIIGQCQGTAVFSKKGTERKGGLCYTHREPHRASAFHSLI